MGRDRGTGSGSRAAESEFVAEPKSPSLVKFWLRVRFPGDNRGSSSLDPAALMEAGQDGDGRMEKPRSEPGRCPRAAGLEGRMLLLEPMRRLLEQ